MDTVTTADLISMIQFCFLARSDHEIELRGSIGLLTRDRCVHNGSVIRAAGYNVVTAAGIQTLFDIEHLPNVSHQNKDFAAKLLLEDIETGEELRPCAAPTSIGRAIVLMVNNAAGTRTWKHTIHTEMLAV